ncbi:hypothetical protein [Microtetraspora malaysiensis]|uniref:hypothetical protein n=1 Tax=Microtetraspora malaysiensis TaxID=161358 RepID=UPI003D91C6C2
MTLMGRCFSTALAVSGSSVTAAVSVAAEERRIPPRTTRPALTSEPHDAASRTPRRAPTGGVGGAVSRRRHSHGLGGCSASRTRQKTRSLTAGRGRNASGAVAVLFPVGTSYRGPGTTVTTCRLGTGSGKAVAPPTTSRLRAVPCGLVGMIGSRTARASRMWVAVAVTGGPVAMLPPMAGASVMLARPLARAS